MRTIRAVLDLDAAKIEEAQVAAPKQSRNFIITTVERSLLKEFCVLMEVFAAATDEMQSDTSLISQVLPCVVSLRKFIAAYIEKSSPLKKVC